MGYGRTGRWFWAFEQRGVVPDIVCVAKAMGSSQPLGAVITTKAIADAYRTQGTSSHPPAAAGVQRGQADRSRHHRERASAENAVTVGDHIVARINELATATR